MKQHKLIVTSLFLLASTSVFAGDGNPDEFAVVRNGCTQEVPGEARIFCAFKFEEATPQNQSITYVSDYVKTRILIIANPEDVNSPRRYPPRQLNAELYGQNLADEGSGENSIGLHCFQETVRTAADVHTQFDADPSTGTTLITMPNYTAPHADPWQYGADVVVPAGCGPEEEEAPSVQAYMPPSVDNDDICGPWMGPHGAGLIFCGTIYVNGPPSDVPVWDDCYDYLCDTQQEREAIIINGIGGRVAIACNGYPSVNDCTVSPAGFDTATQYLAVLRQVLANGGIRYYMYSFRVGDVLKPSTPLGFGVGLRDIQEGLIWQYDPPGGGPGGGGDPGCEPWCIGGGQ